MRPRRPRRPDMASDMAGRCGDAVFAAESVFAVPARNGHHPRDDFGPWHEPQLGLPLPMAVAAPGICPARCFRRQHS